MKFQPRSLQQRTLIYTLLPTLTLLVALSFFGFIFVRDLLIKQWGESVVLSLQRSAELIETKLQDPKRLLSMLEQGDDSDVDHRFLSHIIEEVKKLDGVVEVTTEWPEQFEGDLGRGQRVSQGPKKRGKIFIQRFQVSSPKFDNRVNNQTISLISELTGAEDKPVGHIEVIVSFTTLVDQVINATWWKNNKAFIIDGEYNVLMTTGGKADLEDYFPMRAFGTMSKLEEDTLDALKMSNSGTVLGPGIPPEEISGFYRLSEVPWTLVVTAPGKKVLAPIIQFRRNYMISLAVCICLIMIFIRLSMNQITSGIKRVSGMSNDLANGNFGPPLEVTTQDEVGELTANFNKMTHHLQQRLELKKNIDLAKEVQQNLLPVKGFSSKEVKVYGKTLYCDETGGDYYDILQFDKRDNRVGVVVGDVVGHGVAASLLMTTVRALVRSGYNQSRNPGTIISDVNVLLYQDTEASGSFVTLFYLEFDHSTRVLHWVRAGHDPAMMINCDTKELSELKGDGIALGVDPDWRFESNEISVRDEAHVVLICSDGVFEATNEYGEQFSRNRVQQLFLSRANSKPEIIINFIIDEIQSFTNEAPLTDDITLTIVKIE